MGFKFGLGDCGKRNIPCPCRGSNRSTLLVESVVKSDKERFCEQSGPTDCGLYQIKQSKTKCRRLLKINATQCFSLVGMRRTTTRLPST